MTHHEVGYTKDLIIHFIIFTVTLFFLWAMGRLVEFFFEDTPFIIVATLYVSDFLVFAHFISFFINTK